MGLRVMMAGGGTGGHVFPAVAVAQTLRQADRSHEVIFVGTEQGLESRIVPEAGYVLHTIPARGLKGLGLEAKWASLKTLPSSLWASRKVIQEFRPNVVFGTGGYAAGPVLLEAVWLRTPTVIFEPNAQPGLTNRWLAPWVTRSAVTFEEAAKRLGARSVRTGTPVRREFLEVPDLQPTDPVTVLIFGGSRGAKKLNQAVIEALPFLKQANRPLWLIHQTGEEDSQKVCNAYRRAGVEADVRPFIHDMAACFARAHMVVSRSGAITVAELTAAGRPAILIPYPFATDHHQLRNAQALVRAGAARLVEQKEATGRRLAQEILGLLEEPQVLTQMARSARNLSVPDAAEQIVKLLQAVAR